MAERILMNEYKSLSQEDWVNIDVRSIHHPGTPAILQILILSASK